MPLETGTRLGSYEIVAPIGAGGMGEVYRARDSKLGREVAVKVLPEAFSQDKERVSRFEREARLLASLNHPGIATIHGLEEDGGRQLLVMELVEGETLADRIARGAIPVDDATSIFTDIAEALEAAHERGVIHRDLKPANIKITPDGKVKLLDFGLAKAFEPEQAIADFSQSPTLTRLRQGYGGQAKGTALGAIMGTASYMSPEQACGKPVDKRTDIWAFGCCLYEALTGKKAFEGEVVTETLAAVLKNDPDWKALPAGVPGALHQALRLCLENDKNDRLCDVGDLRLVMKGAFEKQTDVWAEGKIKKVSMGGGAPIVICEAANPLGASWPANDTIVYSQGSNGVFQVSASGGTPNELVSAGISSQGPSILPDGRTLLYSIANNFVGLDDAQIIVRNLETGEQRVVVEGGVDARYVPTGHLVYASGRDLHAVPFDLDRLEVTGGPVPVAENVRILSFTAAQFSFSNDGTMVYLSGMARENRLAWMTRDGMTELLPLPDAHYEGAQLSPDGRMLAVHIIEGGRADLWVYDIERDALSKLTFTGNNMFPIWTPDSQRVTFSSGTPGNLFYVLADGGAEPERLSTSDYLQIPTSWSPDGRILAFQQLDNLDNNDIQMLHVEDGGSAEPFLNMPNRQSEARFSPDGRWIAYKSNESGRDEIFVRSFPDGGGKMQISTNGGDQPMWAPKGGELFYMEGESDDDR